MAPNVGVLNNSICFVTAEFLFKIQFVTHKYELLENQKKLSLKISLAAKGKLRLKIMQLNRNYCLAREIDFPMNQNELFLK